MPVSFLKNRCPNWAAIIAGLTLAFATPTFGADGPGSSFIAKYKIDFQSRVAYHAFAPTDLASVRQTIEAEQEIKYKKNWSAVIGGRAYAEGAFATNDGRYNAPVRKNESLDLIPGEIYLQYREGPFRLRVGNQNVVWGEAFGAYYADIVNPKDMREFALGDVANWRLPIPMVNATTFVGDSSFQAIYIPQPFFNKMPSIGNDFALPYATLFPGANVTLSDSRTLPLQFENGEVGLRATTLVSGFDLGAFVFSYHDRFPAYAMKVTNPAPLSLELTGQHPRLLSYGVTGSKSLNQVVLRWELLHTRDRRFDAIQNGLYVNRPSNESTGVLGLDYNGFENYRVGFQFSKIYRSENIIGALTRQNRNLINFHLNATLWKSPVVDVIFNYVPDDGSTLTELRLTVPASHQFEITLGTDLFTGSPQSQFGIFHAGSRGFVQLHGYFGG
jgi:hypothetical protein